MVKQFRFKFDEGLVKELGEKVEQMRVALESGNRKRIKDADFTVYKFVSQLLENSADKNILKNMKSTPDGNSPKAPMHKDDKEAIFGLCYCV